jgi:hypothetical protein
MGIENSISQVQTDPSFFESDEGMEFLGKLWEVGLEKYEPTERWIRDNLPLNYKPFNVFEDLLHEYYWQPEQYEKLFEAFPDELKKFPRLALYGRMVVYFNNINVHLKQAYYLGYAELLWNCSDKFANYVQVYLDEGFILMGDNIEYRPRDLRKTLRRLNKPFVVTTKTDEPGGCGIFSIRSKLGEYEAKNENKIGKLMYLTDGKRIFSLLMWDETAFEQKYHEELDSLTIDRIYHPAKNKS